MLDTEESGSDGTELELDESEGDTTCPLCEEFEGPMSSVQAHISGSTDSDHSGRIGKDVMSESDDSDSSETIEFPENPNQSEPDEDLELVEESDPGGSDESDETDEEPAESVENEPESVRDLGGAVVTLGIVAALIVFLRGNDNADVPQVEVL
jgi:hypothetical protein